MTAGGLVLQHVRTAMKIRRFTPSSLLSLIVFSSTALSVAAEMHTWTNLTGQQIQGEMTGMDVAARAVKVRRKDGLEFNLPIANLSLKTSPMLRPCGGRCRRMAQSRPRQPPHPHPHPPPHPPRLQAVS